ncbi:MAG TPA: DUF1015 domain-containing protein [Candidatus Methanoperedens sp.]|nr:DUF1015 domain-containing protein [Candidatus Methanoperedens sp.]
MPRILPFRGVRYDPARVPDLTRVTAPPYDMISPVEQEELYRRDPHNVVRLILGREREDGRPVDRYANAAVAWRAWRAAGVLAQDPADALYLYREDYAWAGRAYQRLGLIARVVLDEFGGGAFAHEATMSGPKADRLRLLQACAANFSQIFALYSDPDGSVEAPLVAATAAPPLVSFDDGRGVVHNLWRADDPGLIARVREGLAGRPFIIADGHHRYETALEYRRLMRQDPARYRESMEATMMCLVRMESPGLTILPFHRLLAAPDPGSIDERLAAAFTAAERALPGDRARWTGAVQDLLAAAGGMAFGLCRGGASFTLLRPKPGYDFSRHLRPGTSPLIADLDVTVLHQGIFAGLLGLDEQRLVQEGGIRFFSKPEDAAAEIEAGRGTAVFFLRPSRIEQVWRIATAGVRMPQKSTNFYPKLISGLVFNEL